MRWSRAAVAAAVCALGAVTACGRAPEQGRGGGPLTVLAAASLTDAFEGLGQNFRAGHPGADIRFSFDGSSSLVQKAVAGAPADVLATADEATMDTAMKAGVVTAPEAFARNRMAILVAPGNPRRVKALSDLARPDLIVVVCAPPVPCGRAAASVVERAGVTVTPRSLEPNVKGVVAKVSLGEADAGVVFATDAQAAAAAGTGTPVAIPDEQNVTVVLRIAVLAAAANPSLAAEFVATVLSPQGQRILSEAGFLPR